MRGLALLLALLTALFPLAALFGPGVGALESLYDVGHWFTALWIGVATTWTLAVSWLTGELIFRGADQRFAVAFARNGKDGDDWANDHWLETRLSVGKRDLGCAVVLFLAFTPSLIALAVHSPKPGLALSMAILGHALVLALLRWESRHRPLLRSSDEVHATLRSRLPVLSRRLEDPRWREILAGYDDIRGHWVAAVMMGVTLIFYLLGAFVLQPWREGALVAVFPALGYVLILATLFALVLPGLSFLLDGFRVPTLLAMAVVMLPLQLLFPQDNLFEVTRPGISQTLEPATAAQRRLGDEAEPVLVVVASSGGGGQAAVWTSQVFAGLADDGEWGPRVLDSIAAVSTVSGGSVGAMYWVDGYGPDGPPIAAHRRQIEAAAAGPALEAMSWGVVYP
ncbi:MAG: hypothetical protein KC431_17595, partial [Myxococcales bacterium]|nr:hypothetical protein [Myxococcales bacterium]